MPGIMTGHGNIAIAIGGAMGAMEEEKMKQSEKKAAEADRRSFLKLAGAGVVGSGAALAATVAPAAAASTEPAADAGSYRESDHVKRYYELAKFI